MKIVLVDESNEPDVTYELLREIARALRVQLFEHYAPFCQSAGCDVVVAKSLLDVEKGDAPLVVFDDPDAPGVLGYHSVSPTGLAYGKAFVSVVRGLGGELLRGAASLSVTLSHEALEMLHDPYANAWADMPDGETEEAVEICDRVEGDAYEIEGVAVSNFLGPRAFRGGEGPYDWLRLVETPWDIRPGGYVIRRRGGPAGEVFNLFGAAYPEIKRELKASSGRAMMARRKREP